MKSTFLMVAILFSQIAIAQNKSNPHLLKNDTLFATKEIVLGVIVGSLIFDIVIFKK